MCGMAHTISPCFSDELPARDVRLELGASPGAFEVMVARVVGDDEALCLELDPADGGAFNARITRTEAEWIDLREGDILFARA
jgi:hypothetical protein